MSDNEIEMSDSTAPAPRFSRPRRGIGNLWQGGGPSTSTRSISGSTGAATQPPTSSSRSSAPATPSSRSSIPANTQPGATSRSLSGSIPLGSRSISGASASSVSTRSGSASGSGSKPSSTIGAPGGSAAAGGGGGGKAMYGLAPPPSSSSTSSLTVPSFSPSLSAPPSASTSTSTSKTTVKQTSPPPPNSSRRSSLAQLVHSLDMSDNEVEHLTVLPEEEGDGEPRGVFYESEESEEDESEEYEELELEYLKTPGEGGYPGGMGGEGALGGGGGLLGGEGGVGAGAGEGEGDVGEERGEGEVGEEDDSSSSDSEDSESSSDEDEDEDADPNAVHSTESKPPSSIALHPPSVSISTTHIHGNAISISNLTNGSQANGQPVHVGGEPMSVSSPLTPSSKYISGPGVPPPSSGVGGAPSQGPGLVQGLSGSGLVAPTPPPGATDAGASAGSATPAEVSSTATVKPKKGKEKADGSTSTSKDKDKEKGEKGEKGEKTGKGKKHRSPSPSPPPPVVAPPITTIRLEIKLGGPSNYEVDVMRRAKETGQRAWSPEPVQVVEPVPEVVVQVEEGEGKRKRKVWLREAVLTNALYCKQKKSIAQEYYDTSDPFIDDSELAVDQRTYFAQTKQQGFYVSSGEVALLKDPTHKSPKKPKSKKPGLGGSLSVASGSGLKSGAGGGAGAGGKGGGKGGGDGTRDSPIALVDEEEGHGHGEPRETLYGVISKGIRGVGLVTSAGMIGHGAGAMKVDLGLGLGGVQAKDSSSGHLLGVGVGGGAYGGVSVSAPVGGGRGASVVEVEEEGDERAGMKRKRYITVVEGGKKRKIVNVNSFHPDLQAAIDVMKASIAAENWEQKGKFPPTLKPKLAELALKAIKLDEYDDHFFNLMPVLFPYNKFTMTKLIKRTVYPDHVALLQERQDELLKQLEDFAKAGFTRAEEEYQKSLQQWSARQEKLKLEAHPAGGGDGASADGSNAPTRHPTEERDKDAMDVEMPAPSQAAATEKKDGQEKKEKDHPPPSRRYRLTEQMRGIIWDLVLLSNEACRLENEKNSYEGSVIQVSEQGGRKVLYQKIVAAFPEGWMSSGQISRDVSAMKKRFEKEAMEIEES